MPERIQLRRTKGWRLPPGAINCARPSKWGNWYRVARIGDRYDATLREALPDPNAFVVEEVDKWGMRTGAQWAGFADRTEASAFAVELHRRSLLATRVDLDGLHHHDYYLGPLRGHDLACYCALDDPCHVDTLLDLANREDA